MSDADSGSRRSTRILADLQDAVERMHVLVRTPRVVLCRGRRVDGARPMAWQVLFERSLGPHSPTLMYRGAAAASLSAVFTRGFDAEPSADAGWAHRRLVDAMAQGPVIQVFDGDRIAVDGGAALVGVLVFEEDGLDHEAVADALRTAGLGDGNTQSQNV